MQPGARRDVGYWTDLAQLLERGGFTCLFLADVHGIYSVCRGSREAAVRHAVQCPSNDPTLIIAAMAHATLPPWKAERRLSAG